MASATYEKILDAAEDLMVSRGYNAFSYADISAEVGVGKATIHHHFPTKADLAEKVLARYRAKNRRSVEELLSSVSDPAERLGAYIGYWEDCIRRKEKPFCIGALLASEIPSLPEGVVRQVQGHFSDLASWLAAIIDDGTRAGTLEAEKGAAAEAEMLMATVHGAMLAARVAGSDPEVFSAIARRAVEQILQRPMR
ncbi:TetR/AcrR family transcriptional regulator [Sinorhizobium mexicanum]|uniref:TetR/AcrR family transcriptional regulator n=1 Tax=Sinorhizobium mexicanum TaxID=375549 RepID=A0A859QLC7_9HYPH|nr:TetR/AcrR family transcriptional regulator [Sinorhizobium mexicanum]MBP1882947.1 TetR/AcrR family transcriptional repressor of nem operon [Sinorhizobium mexicanum]QLL60916.1 TetR/AcrR family transcriptional regulator [Sinorhizobium mexicanum]